MLNYPQIDTELSVEELSEIFREYTFEERIKKIYDYFDLEEVLVTSSFGTKSVFLLHLLSKIQPDQKIHFIDTTYHFPETINYKNQLIEQFGLQVIDVLPEPNENDLTREESWWIQHPKMCCSINKISPLEPIISRQNFDPIWIYLPNKVISLSFTRLSTLTKVSFSTIWLTTNCLNILWRPWVMAPLVASIVRRKETVAAAAGPVP